MANRVLCDCDGESFFKTGMSSSNSPFTGASYESSVKKLETIAADLDILESKLSGSKVFSVKTQIQEISNKIKNHYVYDLNSYKDQIIKVLEDIFIQEGEFSKNIQNDIVSTASMTLLSDYVDLVKSDDYKQLVDKMGMIYFFHTFTTMSKEVIEKYEIALTTSEMTTEIFDKMGPKAQNEVVKLLEAYVSGDTSLGDPLIALKSFADEYSQPSLEDLYNIDSSIYENKEYSIEIKGNEVYIDVYLEFSESLETNDKGLEYWDELTKNGSGITYADHIVNSFEKQYSKSFVGDDTNFRSGMNIELECNVHVSNQESGLNSRFKSESFSQDQEFMKVTVTNSAGRAHNHCGGETNWQPGDSSQIDMFTEYDDGSIRSEDAFESTVAHELGHTFGNGDQYSSTDEYYDNGFTGTIETSELLNTNIMKASGSGDIQVHDLESILTAASEAKWQCQQNLAVKDTLGDFIDDETNHISNAIKK